MIDEGYTRPLQILIKSLLHYNKWFDFDFIVFEWGQLSGESKRRLRGCYEKIKFEKIKTKKYRDCVFGGRRTWSFNPAYRYDLFSLRRYDKIVYLDADMLVVDDISGLLEHQVDFAACPLQKGEGMELSRDVGNPLKKGRTGFNAGLLVVSKTYLNKRVLRDLVQLTKSRNSPHWSGNQVVLNIYFQDRWTPLPQCYNRTTDLFKRDIAEETKIFHFVGESKPWQKGREFSEYHRNKIGLLACRELLAIWKRHARMLGF